ncbi:Fc.00g048840.m01.CDS01 [Cosmosporella sp. VM-42]
MVVGDTTFLQAEAASRMRTSLNAAGGFYDQVVAISQRMINVGLKKIHDSNKDVMGVFDGSNDYGSISADIDASQIQIPVAVADAFNVIWLWNFTTGTLTAKLPNGVVKKYPMDGWSIAVRVPLVQQDLRDDPNDDEATKQYKKERRQWIADNFDVPGDYRPERLYAKMADAHWNDMKFEKSSFIIDGKRTNWDSWSRIGDNRKVADSLKMILQNICYERETQGLTSAGFSFKFDPKEPLDPQRATYPPQQLQHQSYPYLLPPSSGMTDKAWTEGLESVEEDPGLRNCLLYCELVDSAEKRPFKGVQLPHVGNFSAIGGPNGTPAPIDGTFALSHQLFFERFLLPNLQVFVQQSQIYPRPAIFSNDGNTIRSVLGYIVGANPDKDKFNDRKNPIYEFQAIPAKNGQPAYYQGHVDVTQELEPFASPSRGEWTKFYAEGSPTVMVKWESGGKRITISGETNYRSHGTTGSTTTVDPGTHYIVPANTWWHGWYEMTWLMHIDVIAEKGSLTMKLSHDPTFVSVVDHGDNSNGWKWDDPTTPAQIQSTIQNNMTQQLSHLQETLNAGFTDQLKFTYPGNGQLNFGNTIFNDNGDLLAEIKYADLPDGKVIISRPLTISEPPTTGGTVITCPGGNTTPPKPTTSRLTWTANTPLKASKRPAATGEDTRIELRLTGKNEGTTPAYLSSISTSFEGHKNSKQALFNVLSFVTAPTPDTVDNVLIGVEITPAPADNAPKLSAKLKVIKNSARSYTCNVTIETASGAITIPAGGCLSITAKGVSGEPAAPGDLAIDEIWSDDQGVIQGGDNAGFRVPLTVVLE